MVKRHLSRLRAPRSWTLKRKGIHFITRPRAGAHSFEESVSLSLLLTNILKYAQTQKEVRKILHEGKILVNNKVKKDHAYAVGLMDVVHVPAVDETHRILYTKKGEIFAHPLQEKERDVLLLKIENKTLLKGGKIQLNYTNGSTMLTEKDVYKTGDTLVRSLSNSKIIEHLPFTKGAHVYITGGKNVGRIGVLEEVHEDTIVVTSGTDTFKTAKTYAFVVGTYLTITP